jgi:hypothetical protein
VFKVINPLRTLSTPEKWQLRCSTKNENPLKRFPVA